MPGGFQLLDPFKYEFFRNGAAAGVLIGALCGLLGVYIVLRGMSYIGHGLSHAVFGGAAVAYVSNADLNLWAGVWGFAAAVLINWTVRRFKISADAAIGVITTASFAIGVAVISRLSRFTRSIEGYLFGSILGVTPEALAAVAVVALIVGIGAFLLHKPLVFLTFDQETAQVYGVRTLWLDTAFSLALAAVIIVSMQVIGVTLIAAAIVIPPITARLLTKRFNRMVLISVIWGALTAFMGIYLSFPLDISSGASIVLVQAAGFIVALAANVVTRHGEGLIGGFDRHV
jgi:manganese/iron transport system permease protein/iron/zinc/copper transport system permease protein